MRKLQSIYFSKAIISVIPASISLLLLLPGCSSAPTSYRWLNPNLMTNDWSLTRDIRDDWAKKITDLPIELHGTIKNQRPENTASMIQNVFLDDRGMPVNSGDILSTKQRIVLYVDQVDLPVRQDFCSLTKKTRSPQIADQALTLRGAVCDGEKIVCYAVGSENSVSDQSGNIGEQVSHLKKSLIAALYPGLTLKQARVAGW